MLKKITNLDASAENPAWPDRAGRSCRTAHHQLAHAFTLCALVLILLSCGASGAPDEESAQIAEALRLQEGLYVADIGAGAGEWAEELARRVGKTGHVYATEVDKDLLKKIRKRVKKEQLQNVTTIQGTSTDTGLPEDCCDAILLRLVYHHMTDPQPMRESLHTALKPGGLLMIIELQPRDTIPELPGVPDRGGHGISPENLMAEMISAGFEVLVRFDEWDEDGERYCIIFGH